MQCTLSTYLACCICPFGATHRSYRVASFVCQRSQPLRHALGLPHNSHLFRMPRHTLHRSMVSAARAATATEARP